jgi:lysosomal alpha-mannosidase
MAIAQHHDAVAGTERQDVAYDYAKRLAIGRANASVAVNHWLQTIVSDTGANYTDCELANVTICAPLQSTTTQQLLFFNPQGQPVNDWRVRLPYPVASASYAVIGPDGKAVASQILPASDEDHYLRTINGGSTAQMAWLTFTVNLPAFGYSVYFLQPTAADAIPVPDEEFRSTSQKRLARMRHVETAIAQDIVLRNNFISVVISGATGMLASWTDIARNVTIPITQEIAYYAANHGDWTSIQPSGAYIFRPNISDGFLVPVGNGSVAVTAFTSGPVVQEVRQVLSSWVSQVIRLYPNRTTLELEWCVGPIPGTNKSIDNGKEVVSRLSASGLATNATWYTDANGREMYQRNRDARPWGGGNDEPVAGNYYPVNTAIKTVDTSSGITLTVMPDRTEGGGSLQDGAVELMLHRRLLGDDLRGVSELLALNESSV